MECEIPEFYTHCQPVARKSHRCCECSSPIHKGETHFKVTAKWDGRICTLRQHLACMEACMEIRDNFEGGECIPFGYLMEWWGERMLDKRHDRKHPGWKRLRGLMATILRRDRSHA